MLISLRVDRKSIVCLDVWLLSSIECQAADAANIGFVWAGNQIRQTAFSTSFFGQPSKANKYHSHPSPSLAISYLQLKLLDQNIAGRFKIKTYQADSKSKRTKAVSISLVECQRCPQLDRFETDTRVANSKLIQMTTSENQVSK